MNSFLFNRSLFSLPLYAHHRNLHWYNWLYNQRHEDTYRPLFFEIFFSPELPPQFDTMFEPYKNNILRIRTILLKWIRNRVIEIPDYDLLLLRYTQHGVELNWLWEQRYRPTYRTVVLDTFFGKQLPRHLNTMREDYKRIILCVRTRLTQWINTMRIPRHPPILVRQHAMYDGVASNVHRLQIVDENMLQSLCLYDLYDIQDLVAKTIFQKQYLSDYIVVTPHSNQ